jgi:hypothetical protein
VRPQVRRFGHGSMMTPALHGPMQNGT